MPVCTAQSTLDLSDAVWRKSSRSSNAGDNGACVEVAFADAVWRKSSRSSNAGSNGACVEVAFAGVGVAVRDSKNRDGTVLVFPANQWSGFLTALR
ncbi:MAG: DUF397 domain-containing protein [Sciscionella sp.]